MAMIEFVRNYSDHSTDRGYQFEFRCDLAALVRMCVPQLGLEFNDGPIQFVRHVSSP